MLPVSHSSQSHHQTPDVGCTQQRGINLTTNYANRLKDGGTLGGGLYANELLRR